MEKYLGNKRVLLDDIFNFCSENCPDAKSMYDVFSGTTNVARMFQVKGFSGYTLHIAIFEDAIYLLSAFRPGLSDIQKIAHTKQSLKHRDR